MPHTALYIVATPIGNLSDITLRAIEILKSVDWIAAEDTRHSQHLLSHYQIHTPYFSLHEHNEDERIKKIIALLSDNKSVALISDAGTPLISDPGFRLVRAIRQAHFPVVPIPGACAAIAALCASGIPTDHFIFEGFLPAKAGALEQYLEKLKKEIHTLIFYESVHRIAKTIPVMQKILGNERIAVIARELTKSFESIMQGTLQELSAYLIAHPEKQKGEFVIIVQGANAEVHADTQLNELLKILLSELSVKQAVNLAVKITGLSKNSVYECALRMSDR